MRKISDDDGILSIFFGGGEGPPLGCIILGVIIILGIVLGGFLMSYIFPIVGGIILLSLIFMTGIAFESDWSGITFLILGLLRIGAGLALYFTTNLIVEALPAEVSFWKIHGVFNDLVNSISFWSIAGLFGLFGLIFVVSGIIKMIADSRY